MQRLQEGQKGITRLYLISITQSLQERSEQCQQGYKLNIFDDSPFFQANGAQQPPHSAAIILGGCDTRAAVVTPV